MQDYKKHSTRNHGNRNGKSKNINTHNSTLSWAGISLAIAILLFTGFLFYLSKSTRQTVATKKAIITTEKTNRAHRKQGFDFYTLLPKLSVEVPASNKHRSIPTPPLRTQAKVPTKITQSGNYLLQTGSFSDLSEANRMKANLALLGIVANIKPAIVNNDRWYRVLIGPINHLDRLDLTINQLQRHKIKPLVIKIPG